MRGTGDTMTHIPYRYDTRYQFASSNHLSSIYSCLEAVFTLRAKANRVWKLDLSLSPSLSPSLYLSNEQPATTSSSRANKSPLRSFNDPWRHAPPHFDLT
jgi:hypothetical protein